MAGSIPSSKFTAIYDTLPPDSQRALVEKQLIPLLNSVEKTRARKVLSAAASLQRRHAKMPVLDLRAKKYEINALLDELHRDAKRSFIKDRSHRSELLSETVDSLTDWLSDIWSVVYEHNVEFAHAHKCLMFAASTLEHIGSGRCRCPFTNMYVSVTLKRRNGKHVKTFNINGAHNLEDVLLFIWRDLFLSLLATGGDKLKQEVPAMLDEIEDLMGWNALERILYGGRKCRHGFCDDDNDDNNANYGDLTESEDENDYYTENDHDSFYGDPSEESHYGIHWPWRICNQMAPLRRHIETTMINVFKKTPSLRLFNALCQLSNEPTQIEETLKQHLEVFGTSCADSFVATLDIYASEDLRDRLISLLDSHMHLLRPRDAGSLQNAVAVIAEDRTHHARAMQIIEKELLDSARAIRAAVFSAFSQLDDVANKSELSEILKLRSHAPGRQGRIEHWVDAVSTPGAAAANPMAFAAMMFGFPLPGLDPGEDADPLGYLDMDPTDPDLEDLREEFRPQLKQRFEGWADTATATKGTHTAINKAYKELVETMSFLRATDVVDEMISRLADKPSKHFVCDGLEALSAFVKTQRRRMAEQKRRKEGKASRSTPFAHTAGPSTGPPPLLPPGFASFFGPYGSAGPGPGGMEDVD
ncbi:hypothetical protein CERSUDRAFT_111704 [Gelatoporia subvermispora B]|uniref:Uncharacterized protein n=1 Tax=Ceriporiopsis subvermispora (strain B) TaxID=914234 RepID=M2RRR9_CERS8|nr:hypothetical protein CERSUDRAFT_111704 [Gelatoporia subvermispora B]